MSIWPQKSASIRKRMSLLKFEDNRFCRSQFRSHADAEPLVNPLAIIYVLQEQRDLVELWIMIIRGSLKNSSTSKSSDRNKLRSRLGVGSCDNLPQQGWARNKEGQKAFQPSVGHGWPPQSRPTRGSRDQYCQYFLEIKWHPGTRILKKLENYSRPHLD